MAAFYANAPLPDTNARQGAQTIRPSSTALLTIDSEDRYKDYVAAQDFQTSPYNFAISKSESLMPGFITRLGISEICFPWTIPNINKKTDQIIVGYVTGAGAGQVTITLLGGFYTPAQLATALQSAIIAATGIASFTMVYGLYGQPIFTYASTAPDAVAFLPMTYNSAAYPYPSNTKQLFDLLGFTQANDQTQFSGSGINTFCQAIRYVDIVCNQLTNSQAQKDQTSQPIARDMLARLYLGDGGGGAQSTVPPGNAAFCPPGCAPMTIYRAYPSPKQIQWIPNQNIPGFLQFQVYDDAGDLLDNSDTGNQNEYTGTNWSMTMLVSEC
jgi:hypothetical protein